MRSRTDASLLARLAVVALAACVPPLGAAEVSTDTPDATVRSLHEGLVALATEEPDASVERRYEVLEPLVEATHDLPYIAEFTIRRQWRELSSDDRARFLDAFERLSVMTYASRFTGLNERSFERQEASVDGPQAQVQAAVRRADGSSVPLEYLLREGEDGWKIINILADGVSDLALKRAEYQRVLADGTIDDLIRHLEEQIARLQ
ncbi:MAG TPA: ABC transporter substrate-binding protein [Gammaproteobacteria bacterium]